MLRERCNRHTTRARQGRRLVKAAPEHTPRHHDVEPNIPLSEIPKRSSGSSGLADRAYALFHRRRTGISHGDRGPLQRDADSLVR